MPKDISRIGLPKEFSDKLFRKGIHTTAGLYKLDLTKLNKTEVSSLCYALINIVDTHEEEMDENQTERYQRGI